MAAVDAIYVAGAESLHQVTDAIADQLQVPVSTRRDLPFLQVDERTRIDLYPDSDYPGQWIAEVYHAGEVADRQALARRIYDHLVENTDWDLTLDSDDAADIIASRIKSHTQ